MTFFLILLFIFVIWPLIRVAVTFNRIKRRNQQIFEQMFGSQQNAREPKRRKPGWSKSPSAAKKKIDPTVGEFVAFEEVACYTEHHTPDQTVKSVSVEQQIVDVEWEDI